MILADIKIRYSFSSLMEERNNLVQVFVAVSYQGYKNKQRVHPFPFWQFSAMQML